MKIKIEKILFILLCLIITCGVLSNEKYIHKNLYMFFQCITIGLSVIFVLFFLKLNSNKIGTLKYNCKKNWYVFIGFGLMIINSAINSIYNSSIQGLIYTIMFFLIMIILGIVIPIYLNIYRDYVTKLIKFLAIISTVLSTIAIYIFLRKKIYIYTLVYGRAASIIFDPNFFATFVAVGTICALNMKEKILKYILATINICAIVLSGSRGALLSLVLTFGMAVLIKYRKINLKTIILSIIFLLIVMKGIDYLGSINFFREYQGSNGRVETITYFGDKIKDRPILGYGYASASELLQNNNLSTASSHNSLMDYTISYGIPCALIYIYMLVQSLIKGIKKENNTVFLINLLLIINSNTILYSIGGVGMCSILWTMFWGMNMLEVKNEN